MRRVGLVLAITAMAGCAGRRPPVFRVVKPGSEFALESPGVKKQTETVMFGKLMERQYNFAAGRGYIDLLPGMRVSATRAYFSGAAVKLNEYLGAETGRWTVEPGPRFRFAGATAEPALRKPADAPPIAKLIDPPSRGPRLYRMFFQVRWFTGGRDDARGSVILGAPDSAALEAATKALLGEKMPACGSRLACIPFPAATTVTADVGVEVNGERRWFPWGTTVRSLAPPGAIASLRVDRRWGKAFAPVEFVRGDPESWRFPLLPGDRLQWAAAVGSAAVERVVTGTNGDSAPIAFDTRGNGDTALVFVHGWVSDRSFWREQADAFARDYRVVTLDLTGHGPFAPASPPRFVLALSGDVETVVRDLGLRRVILIGHSMGAAIALNAARRLPGTVRGVVLVAPAMPVIDASALEADFKGVLERTIRSVDWVRERVAKADPATALNLLRDYANLDLAKLRAEAGVPVMEVPAVEGAGLFPQLERPAEFNERLHSLLTAMR